MYKEVYVHSCLVHWRCFFLVPPAVTSLGQCCCKWQPDAAASLVDPHSLLHPSPICGAQQPTVQPVIQWNICKCNIPLTGKMKPGCKSLLRTNHDPGKYWWIEVSIYVHTPLANTQWYIHKGAIIIIHRSNNRICINNWADNWNELNYSVTSHLCQRFPTIFVVVPPN